MAGQYPRPNAYPPFTHPRSTGPPDAPQTSLASTQSAPQPYPPSIPRQPASQTQSTTPLQPNYSHGSYTQQMNAPMRSTAPTTTNAPGQPSHYHPSLGSSGNPPSHLNTGPLPGIAPRRLVPGQLPPRPVPNSGNFASQSTPAMPAVSLPNTSARSSLQRLPTDSMQFPRPNNAQTSVPSLISNDLAPPGVPNLQPSVVPPQRPMYGQRPLPPANRPSEVFSATDGIQNLSVSASYPPSSQQQTSGPPGMLALSIGDATILPRPDMSGPAMAVRIASADPPPVAPQFNAPLAHHAPPPSPVDPGTCPSEIHVPVSPRCVRLTNAAFPNTRVLGVKYSFPLGAIIQPLASPGPNEEPIPVVNFGSAGIVRCRQCRSYINYTSIFLDGGRRWKCSLCFVSNECPSDYFSPLDENGKRRDASERPELRCGSVEFVAPAEYMVRPPMPPVYLFLLETTPAAVNSGVLAAGVAGIRNSINSMPNEGRTRIGLMTFDSTIHFYSLHPGEGSEPSVYIVSDIDDVFLPTPNEILVQLTDCRPCLEQALELILKTYTPSNNMASSASCLGAAVKGAQEAMELIGGKLIVIAASRPTSGPGALRERGDNSMLGTDRERSVLRPDSRFYQEMAVTMSKNQIACDLFLCPPPPAHFMDVAALVQISKFTGGEIFYCPDFEAMKDAPRLQLAINRVLARESGLEAVMRIRATKSVRCHKFSGRFFVRSTDLLAMPNVDEDKTFTVQFSIEDAILTDGQFSLQVALLYTTTSGERRIRVHTLAVPLVNNLHDLFSRLDTPATINIMMRTAADAIKNRNLNNIREEMADMLISALVKYRESCQSQYSSVNGNNQLLLTDAMKLLPLYLHGIGRSAILCRDTAGAFLFKFDDKSALVHDIDAMNVAETGAIAYPNIIPVYPWPNQGDRPVKHPNGMPASFSALRADFGILIDDGRDIILWLGDAVVPRFLSELLDDSSTGSSDSRYLGVQLMRRGGTAKGVVSHVFALVKSIVGLRQPSIPVHVVLQGDRLMQARIEALMTEERTASMMNYRDFMLDIQRKVAQKTAR